MTLVREATPQDAAAMRAIYAPYVEGTAVSFEDQVPDPAEFEVRVAKYLLGWACVVAEHEGEVVAYAYGSPHRERAAYRWSVETTVYVAPAHQRRGLGRRLYAELLPRLQARGFCNAFAGVALPNEGSVRLHEAVGFRAIGSFPRVGFKFGQWRDVAWFHRVLREAPPAAG